jgi:plasmid maintenance system antidote protein VapI
MIAAGTGNEVAPSRRRKQASKDNMPAAIRERLKELDLNVVDLARKIQVPPSTLYNALGGASEPTHRLAVKLAWGLGWSVDYFTQMFFIQHPLAEITERGNINQTFLYVA